MPEVGPFGPLMAFLQNPDTSDREFLKARWDAVLPALVLKELSTAVTAAATPEGKEELRQYADLLNHSRIRRFFPWLHQSSGAEGDTVSGETLLAALEGMVSGANALAAERAGDERNARGWTERSALAWSRADPAPPVAEESPNSAPSMRRHRGIIEETLLAWRAANNSRIGAARAWLLALRRSVEGNAPENADVIARLEIPLLSYHPADGTAHISRLILEAVPGDGECCPDPITMALTPISDSFRNATGEAESAARKRAQPAEQAVDLRWTLLGLGGAPASGGSHGAAFAILCIQLWRGETLPPEVVITGRVAAEDGRVEAVAYVREKTRAALSYQIEGQPPLSQILVPAENAAEAWAGARDRNRGRLAADVIAAVQSLDDCLPLMTDRLVQQAVAQRIAAGEIERICEMASERTGRRWASVEDVERFCVPACLTLEYAFEGVQQETSTHSWDDLSGRYRRLLVNGYPGTGKSLLLWNTVARRCRPASQGDSEGTFAALFSAAQLSEALGWKPETTENPENPETTETTETSAKRDFVAAVVYLLENRHRLSEMEKRWVQRRVESGDCLVAVDALDELEAEGRGKVRYAIRQAAPGCRYVVTQRPSTMGEFPLVLGEEARAMLEEFSLEQMSQALNLWFNDDPERSAAFRRSLGQQENAHYLRVLRVPLYLRIACQLVEAAHAAGRETPRWRRRSDLYEHLLRGLQFRWADRSPFPDRIQQRLFGTLVADLAFELFGLPHLDRRDTIKTGLPARLQEMARGDIPEPEVIAPDYLWNKKRIEDAAAVVFHRDPEIAFAFDGRKKRIVDDLLSAGILTQTKNQDDNPLDSYAFPHQTLGEYLAARSLSDTWKTLEEGEVKRRLERIVDRPQWHEIVVFLSGCLADPVPLFDVLLDEKREATTRARVVLAAECLREVTP